MRDDPLADPAPFGLRYHGNALRTLRSSYRAASFLFCSRRVTALGEPYGQAAIPGIRLELFGRHSLKGSGKCCVFEFDRLLGLPFCARRLNANAITVFDVMGFPLNVAA